MCADCGRGHYCNQTKLKLPSDSDLNVGKAWLALRHHHLYQPEPHPLQTHSVVYMCDAIISNEKLKGFTFKNLFFPSWFVFYFPF